MNTLVDISIISLKEFVKYTSKFPYKNIPCPPMKNAYRLPSLPYIDNLLYAYSWCALLAW